MTFPRCPKCGAETAPALQERLARCAQRAKCSGVNDYMKTLLTVVILFGLIGSVAAQKKSSFAGDLVIGEVTGTNDATREITIKYPGKAGPEVFSGFLIDGYKIKLPDGSWRELAFNEITPGIRVRAFYKSATENVSGQKKKIYRITSFEFLGSDEWARLRYQLSVPPSTAVVKAANDDLPSASPLKIYVTAGYDHLQRGVIGWIGKWNEKHAEAPYKLELVSDMDQADVLLVIARGSDTQVVTIPMEFDFADKTLRGSWTQSTAYLAFKDGEGLKVLWTGIAPIFISEAPVDVSNYRGLVVKELEKRLKARARKTKK